MVNCFIWFYSNYIFWFPHHKYLLVLLSETPTRSKLGPCFARSRAIRILYDSHFRGDIWMINSLKVVENVGKSKGFHPGTWPKESAPRDRPDLTDENLPERPCKDKWLQPTWARMMRQSGCFRLLLRWFSLTIPCSSGAIWEVRRWMHWSWWPNDQSRPGSWWMVDAHEIEWLIGADAHEIEWFSWFFLVAENGQWNMLTSFGINMPKANIYRYINQPINKHRLLNAIYTDSSQR